jgi:hypothetical protein
MDSKMEVSEKPLAFRECTNYLRLGGSALLVYEEGSDVPVPYDPHHYKQMGRPFLRKGLPILKWEARTEKASISELAECHCFFAGLLISPRIRSIIENYDSPNIEYIPLAIKNIDTGKHLADWWYCNVFNWKDAFDFDSSVGEWVDFPILNDTYHGEFHLMKQFSNKLLINMKKLVVLPSALEGGLFLARAPTGLICRRLFVGHELGREIEANMNDTATPIDVMGLEVFDPLAGPKYLQIKGMPKQKSLPFNGYKSFVAWLKFKAGF